MLSKNVLATSLLLASFQAVFAAPQTAIVSVGIDVGDADDSDSDDDVNLQGAVAGVGSDGTTYVLSYAETYMDEEFSSTTFIETFTLVQDATHVSYAIVETADSLSYADILECGLDGKGNGVCTEDFIENDSFTAEEDQIFTSGSIVYYAAEITGSGGVATASASASSVSNTGVGSSASATANASSSSSTGVGSSAKSSGSSSASGSTSAAASSSSSSSSASTIIASGFASVIATLFGVAFVL